MYVDINYNMMHPPLYNKRYLMVFYVSYDLLVFRRKVLCEARVKPEMSSNFQMKCPDKLSDIPPGSCQMK